MPSRRSPLDALLYESDRQLFLARRSEEQKRRRRLFEAFEDLNDAAAWWDCPSPEALRTLAGLVKRLASVLYEDRWSAFLDRLPASPGDKERTIEFLKEARQVPPKQIAGRLQRFMDGSKGVIRVRNWLVRLYDEIVDASVHSAPKLNETQLGLLKLIAGATMKGEILAKHMNLSYEHVRHVLAALKNGGLLDQDEHGYILTNPGRYALRCAST
jgi:predicted transcriptional regulator